MATRHPARQAARRRPAAARSRATKTLGRSLYRRTLRYEPLEDRRLLAVVTVDTDQDVVDFNDGFLSLREAIFATNTVLGPDTIEFAPALTAEGPATILLTQGELLITDDLTIDGPGADLLTLQVVPDVNAVRGTGIFTIDDGDNATDQDVTISGLTLTGSNRAGTSPYGAVYSRENLTISHAKITGNTRGGGVYSVGSLRIEDSEITNNSSIWRGGGVYLGVGGGRTATIVNSTIAGNEAIYGGGIWAGVNIGGTLEITDCTISGNRAGMEGEHQQAGGGGIFLRVSGNATVSRSAITGNTTFDYQNDLFTGGGGLFVASYGDTRFVDCEISGNVSLSRGGGVFGHGSRPPLRVGNLYFDGCIIANNSVAGIPFSSGTLEGTGGGVRASNNVWITRSVIVGNSAGSGGGVYTNRGITIEDSQFQDNSAINGGGIYVNIGFPEFSLTGSTIADNEAELGGGIFISSGIISRYNISQNTVSNNHAAVGGGIYSTDEETTIQHSTIAFNSALVGAGVFGPITLDHAIVARNSGSDLALLTGKTATVRNSLIGTRRDNGLAEAPVGSPDANGNLVGGYADNLIDPLLGPLADNGGFALPDGSRILTHALLPGSPAINAGDPLALPGESGVPVYDQRGMPFTRVYGGRIDIGAFESQPVGMLLGDYNHNGRVDAADYGIWRDEMTTGDLLYADGNGDGTVNDWDFQLWRNNFGATLADVAVGEGGAAVEGSAAFAAELAVVAQPLPNNSAAGERDSPIFPRGLGKIGTVPDQTVPDRDNSGPHVARRAGRATASRVGAAIAGQQDSLLATWAASLRRSDGRADTDDATFRGRRQANEDAPDAEASAVDQVFTQLGANKRELLSPFAR